jgi:hypothetical protein
MNKQIKNIVSIFIFITISTLIPKFTIATVGGNYTVYDFRYNPKDESVYYLVQDFGGRGCPPTLNKISLESEEIFSVFSCNDGEEKVMKDPSYNVLSDIYTITQNFKNLMPIDLNKNSINIDVNFKKDEFFDELSGELKQKIFNVDIFQNGNKIDGFELSGCYLDQPFSFKGYQIPGFEKKIILLVSRTRDCFEGGYIGESIFVINNIENLNKDYFSSSYKGDDPLYPDKGVLIVSENDSVKEKTNGNSIDKKDGVDYSKTSLFSALSLVLGLILGSLMGRKL